MRGAQIAVHSSTAEHYVLIRRGLAKHQEGEYRMGNHLGLGLAHGHEVSAPQLRISHGVVRVRIQHHLRGADSQSEKLANGKMHVLDCKILKL